MYLFFFPFFQRHPFCFGESSVSDFGGQKKGQAGTPMQWDWYGWSSSICRLRVRLSFLPNVYLKENLINTAPPSPYQLKLIFCINNGAKHKHINVLSTYVNQTLNLEAPCCLLVLFCRFLITGPVSHYFYQLMELWIPSKDPYCIVKRLLLDRLFFAPGFLLIFFGVMNILEVSLDRKTWFESGNWCICPKVKKKCFNSLLA